MHKPWNQIVPHAYARFNSELQRLNQVSKKDPNQIADGIGHFFRDMLSSAFHPNSNSPDELLLLLLSLHLYNLGGVFCFNLCCHDYLNWLHPFEIMFAQEGHVTLHVASHAASNVASVLL